MQSYRFIRSLRPVAAMLAFLLAAIAWQSAGAQSTEPYRLSAGDVVTVTVYGQADLSGQFTVAPDGSIAFPLLGNVAVAGMSPAEFGAQLNNDLAAHIPGLSVSAAVFQYAPVFIVGEVQNPGRYEYRPGMTTLELVALGGGLRRPMNALAQSGLQMIAARQDYADLELQIFGQEAARARLQAEVDDAPFELDATSSDPDPTWSAIKERVVKGERRLFDIRAQTLASEDEALRARQKSYAEEIVKVMASIALHKQEIDLLMEDVAAQKSLVERGLTAKSNLREIERNLSSTRRDALELDSFLARAQQNMLAIEQQRVALKATRRNDAARQVQEAELNLARMRGRQRSLLETMSELALMSGEAAMDAANIQATFSILRLSEGNYVEVDAGEQALLKPGDIVRIAMPKTARRPAATVN